MHWQDAVDKSRCCQAIRTDADARYVKYNNGNCYRHSPTSVRKATSKEKEGYGDWEPVNPIEQNNQQKGTVMRAMMKIFAPKSGQLLVSKGVRIDLNPALDFMTSLGPERVISVNFVPPQIIVWYWHEHEEEKIEGESDACPESGEEDCSKCSGEYCETHGVEPCDCDTAGRHYAPKRVEDDEARKTKCKSGKSEEETDKEERRSEESRLLRS